jgi:hypothetical protein
MYRLIYLLLILVRQLMSPQPRRKNADMCVFSTQSGSEPAWPGVAVEMGYADSLTKSKRDATLWVQYSDGGVTSSLCNSNLGAASCRRENLVIEAV